MFVLCIHCCSTYLRVIISLLGSNVLLLRNNLSCGVHLLYALLRGRPVVVLAEPRNERFVLCTLQLIRELDVFFLTGRQ